jgi:ubiquinone/menaquinone biosynthesis C-methylase UbiE
MAQVSPQLGYDSVYAYHQDDFDPYLELARLQNRTGLAILDMGCGTGFLTYALARAMDATSSILGLDLVQGMLNLALQKKATLAPTKNVNFRRVDITSPAALQQVLLGQRFDIIVSSWVVPHLLNPRDVVRSWATNLLKPGGCLILDISHERGDIHGFSIWEEAGIGGQGIPDEVKVLITDPPHRLPLPSHFTVVDSTTKAECRSYAVRFARESGCMLDLHPKYAYNDAQAVDRSDWVVKASLEPHPELDEGEGVTGRERTIEFAQRWGMENKGQLMLALESTGCCHIRHGHKVAAAVARMIPGPEKPPHKKEKCPCGGGKVYGKCHWAYNCY